MRPALRTFTFLTAIGILLPIPALAEDSKPHGADPETAAMMEVLAKAAAPGEHHRFLAALAGDWEFTSRVWMDPSQPPMKSTGSSKKTMILGGRYLQEEVAGELMGSAFNGRGLTAYDNVAGEFISTWIDSMATSITVARGQRQDDTVTLHGKLLDPMSQQTMKVRQITHVVDADHHVFQYFVTAPGDAEFKSMEIEYERK